MGSGESDSLNVLVREVRREIVVEYGFVGDQAAQLDGVGPEMISRLAERLRALAAPCATAKLSLRCERYPTAYSHMVIITGGVLLDGAVTQFLSGGWRAFASKGVPADLFAFSSDGLAERLPSFDAVELDLPAYPVDGVCGAEWRDLTSIDLYTSRAQLLRKQRTRFCSDERLQKGATPFLNAHATGELDWRRTCAAGLALFAGKGNEEIARLAGELLADADHLTRSYAQRHQAAVGA